MLFWKVKSLNPAKGFEHVKRYAGLAAGKPRGCSDVIRERKRGREREKEKEREREREREEEELEEEGEEEKEKEEKEKEKEQVAFVKGFSFFSWPQDQLWTNLLQL